MGFQIVNGVLEKYTEEDGVTKIIIPEGVTSIGKESFCGCKSLTGIVIPEGVTSIGEYSFFFCKSLTEIAIPEGVTSIERSTFEFCKKLTGITIPKSVTCIGELAFRRCESLAEITIPEGVTSIKSFAFHGCNSLTNVTIPDSVICIGKYAFAGSNINSIVWNDPQCKFSSKCFGDHGLPPFAANDFEKWHKLFTDVDIKNEINSWDKLSVLKNAPKVIIRRFGSTLFPAFAKKIDQKNADKIGKALSSLIDEKSGVRECNHAAAYVNAFADILSNETVARIYEKLKSVKSGKKAAASVEANTMGKEKTNEL